MAKYQSFQYRLLHRAVVTNIQLKHWKLTQTDQCSFCEKERENYEHLFFNCSEVRKMWEECKNICVELGEPEAQIQITYLNVIRNTISDDCESVSNTVCLITKQYIYRRRCEKAQLSQHQLRRVVFEVRNIEKYYAIKDMKYRRVYNKWEKNQSQIECNMVNNVVM